MKAPPCENYPQKFSPEKIAPCENPLPLGKLPPMKSLPTYKSYKWKKKENYKIFCLEENSAIQHPYQNNQGPLWYIDDFTENTGLKYFIYRVKKIQKSNERENGQVAFTCTSQGKLKLGSQI